ncbi:hypothetical protein sS8_0107 [Methylocaldum marinum]|uniref:Uncharacterized protein n=1 Tax=Methylocaldum marinum TaxID=1432792 RepID=A0A286P354_9GAMM|nr:hypothetical protein sS8_0107 [Methylocaldum marinum]
MDVLACATGFEKDMIGPGCRQGIADLRPGHPAGRESFPDATSWSSGCVGKGLPTYEYLELIPVGPKNPFDRLRTGPSTRLRANGLPR